ncbi:carbohydrate ABC transporter permease [Vibrio mimicus]|uniref:sn-glycerol-3-phosphate transport system permease protein UgpE n=1 Tax=Vibrio mimicus TaxID=674 RepID=A0A2J9VKR3_VIBMI|nr:carbohydrate ABC transporter permease [Vibrio mimicus]EEW12211.1 ABC-type sugar transport system, permease component [Vibrio mimicus VM573]KFE33101.1 binding--dependent transport system inner membrane component family protein [Vibrio mimicus]PNM64367.1 carbohydrate ABC transporter permease [Vibrio mimicus]
MCVSQTSTSPLRSTKQGGKRRRDLAKVAIYLFVSLLALISIFPFFWSALLATQDNASIMEMSLSFGDQFLVNYQNLAEEVPFNQAMWNTFVVTVLSTINAVFVSAAAGYAFALYDFKAKNFLFATLMLTMMVPSVVNLVPYFLIIKELTLINTLAAIWLPAGVNIFGVFLIRQFVASTMPKEILDSARVDGLNELQIFFRIGLPMMRSPLMTVAIMVIVAAWNNFMLPLIALQTPDKQIITLVLRSLNGATATPWNLVMTGSFLAMFPLLVIFVLFSKKMMESLIEGAVKG